MNILQRRQFNPQKTSQHKDRQFVNCSLIKDEFFKIERVRTEEFTITRHTPSSRCLCFRSSFDKSNFKIE
jgi:hypothetical protein